MGSKKIPPPDTSGVSELIRELKASQVIASESPEWLAFYQRRVQTLASTTALSFDSYEAMVAFVLDGTGVTEKQFDAGSPKSLRDLFDEIERRDVGLSLGSVSGRTRLIDRYSHNAVGIVFDSRTWEALYEFGRIVIETGALVLHPEPKLQGCRETAMRAKPHTLPGGKVMHAQEPPMITMIRGFLQEPGIAIHERHIIPLTHWLPPVEPHDSTMYVCNRRYRDKKKSLRLRFRSNTASYRFGVDIASLGLWSLEDWPDACGNVHRDADVFLIEDEGVLLMYTIMPIPEGRVLDFLKAKHAEHQARL